MSNVVPFDGGKVPALLKDQMGSDDLSAGVTGGFAVLSIRSSKWRVKYQGEEHPILNADGDPVASLEAVIVKANPHITKNFYAQGYSDGASEAPDCFSLDGLKPDASVEKPQSDTCARCPKNVFGSRITPAGKKAKACQDNRRLAIVPVNDIMNETFGGPMLLRVPAASLAELAMMGKNLSARGFPYNAVSVRIGFDLEASYPKLTFKPIRPLTDDEAKKVVTIMRDDRMERILAEAVEVLPTPEAEAEAPADPLFEQPTPAKATKPKAAPKPKAAAPKDEEADPAPDGNDSLDNDIKGILAELGDLG